MGIPYGIPTTCLGFIRDKLEGITEKKVLSMTGLAEALVAQFLISKTSAYNRINTVMNRDPFKELFEKRKGKLIAGRRRTYIVRKKS